MHPEQRDLANPDDFLKGLWRENPVFIQLLGMCPVLAVTNSALNGLTMGLATLFVLVLSNTLVSLLRNVIPREVRIATFILIIATFVTVVDYVIEAISLELHKSLGAFISLIVVNCLILGRAEAFASQNPPGLSVLDGLGNGLGYALVIVAVAFIRELFGTGAVFGYQLLPNADSGGWFQAVGLMSAPAGAFFVVMLLIWILRSWKTDQVEEA